MALRHTPCAGPRAGRRTRRAAGGVVVIPRRPRFVIRSLTRRTDAGSRAMGRTSTSKGSLSGPRSAMRPVSTPSHVVRLIVAEIRVRPDLASHPHLDGQGPPGRRCERMDGPAPGASSPSHSRCSVRHGRCRVLWTTARTAPVYWLPALPAMPAWSLRPARRQNRTSTHSSPRSYGSWHHPAVEVGRRVGGRRWIGPQQVSLGLVDNLIGAKPTAMRSRHPGGDQATPAHIIRLRDHANQSPRPKRASPRRTVAPAQKRPTHRCRACDQPPCDAGPSAPPGQRSSCWSMALTTA